MMATTMLLDFTPLFEKLQQFNQSAATIGLPIPMLIAMVIMFVLARPALKWNTAERYYVDILQNLCEWKHSLEDRLNYYQEPGSSYIDAHINTPHYDACRNKGSQALGSLRAYQHVAALFLTTKATKAIDRLISEHWYIGEHGAASEQEYLTATLTQVHTASEVVLNSAKKALRRSQYARIYNYVKG